VASRVGGVPELVADGESGALCAPNDVEQLAAALAEVMLDDARRERMGQAARAAARERFDLDRIVAGHVRVYRSLAARGTAAGEWRAEVLPA
jgi:starch synthase